MNQEFNHEVRPPYGIIAILMIGAFISFLNNTLLNVALPSIMANLQVDTATVQWLTTGYMLVNGILIPTTAFLIQKFSVRRLFLIAMGLFSIGTIIAGTATIFPVLLGARMVQASGSAIMMPLLMNVMLVSFPVAKRGTAMGVFGLILMFAPAIGPTLSGWILEHYEWRMLFHFITPIAIVVWILGFILLKDKKEKVDIHLDAISVLLSSIGFGGLLYGFSSAGSNGWNSPSVYMTIIIGVLSLITFIVRQSKLNDPMLNFNVYRYPMFSLASVITMVVNMALFSGFMLLPIYAQTILGISPMKAGLMLLPGAIVNAFMSPITGRLFDKYGGRILAVIGLIIVTGTTFQLSHLSFETTYYYLMFIHAVRMFGLSMVMMPITTNGLNQLPKQLYPHGTAMNNTLNQVSGAIGTAFIITIMSTREAMYEKQLTAQVIGQPTAEAKQHITLEAMLGGINDAFLISTFFIILALALALFIKRATPMGDKPKKSKNLSKVPGNSRAL
ncbi:MULTISPECIES: DHA2 family efflux MFS transporter permease subunit [Bacillaceae]|uniref:MFS transporter n=2 Tax=Bacillales TaxID=1385 RepID=A0ABR5MH19_9BACI|nr:MULTISPECIES: DHA2 family efflux MFS transporter permease subunit [Bacillaceae]KPH72417.1 MFS transporter [Oceanobacillus caeni]MBU8790480.1 DHA2 family efflux MFS transporter permease subunit [Oceanobacillus caeni]MED4475061.1 DHA2 family efflux MFS transporter permease subunit [Oceanobacillus caeni]